MTTEVWFRNPRAYIREIVEVRHVLVVWDKGTLVKHSIDPVKFLDLHVPTDLHYRGLIVGNIEQGCAEFSRGGNPEKPDAVYPVWSAEEESIDDLEEILKYSAGEDPETCEDESVSCAYRPVLGQEHRVILTDIPSLVMGPGRKLIRLLSELQHEYPDAIMHLHATYSWKAMFGNGLRAADFDGRTQAAKGDVYLPNGRAVTHRQAANYPQWVTLLGMKPVELEVPRNRCIYNMKSALWASKNYDTNVKFKSRGDGTLIAADTQTPTAYLKPHEAKHSRTSGLPYQPGDKFTCDTCSVADACKYYRQGAVCSVPGTEQKKLADFFNTRDADSIITGLGALLSKQADRLERGMEDEEYGEELDPEVSKLINSLFGNGVKLAKLTNPELNGGTKVGVFVNGGQGAQVAVGSSASQLTAAIVRELEEKGVAREDITPEMIGQVLSGEAHTQPAIEARAVTEGRE